MTVQVNKQKRVVEVLRYCVFYVFAFALLEHRSITPYILHTPLDDLIPFCEYFIIPYLLWFVYVAVTLIYFGIICDDQKEYYCLSRTLAIGCTVFLVTSFVFPNGQNLRPDLAGDNLFQQAVLWLYSTDTPTNVFPSIHVFNAVACCIAVCKKERLRDRYGVKFGVTLLTVLIILSTVFLKQHTIIDVGGALLLNHGCYRFFYKGGMAALQERSQRRHPRRSMRRKYPGVFIKDQ